MIHHGDVRSVLPTLDAGSVQCVISSPPYWGLRSYLPEGHDQKAEELGLEPTPDAYVEHMVAVFREVKRVLRDDGTCWLNLGDSFQDKQLVGMPWRLAFALQADGWYLRSDIIWAKGVSFCPDYTGSIMPESVTDRPTRSHEYVFLLTKSPHYFYDAEAVRERGVVPGGTMAAKGSAERFGTPGVNSRPPEYKEYSGTRNMRSVWTISPQPYAEAHFATFPEKLVEPCVQAGTSEKGQCVTCGSPWVRNVVASGGAIGGSYHDHGDNLGAGQSQQKPKFKTEGYRRQTTGWSPSCGCSARAAPQTVLDPFAGSGTTGLVAGKLGRKFVGIELNADYITLAQNRIEGPLFAGLDD